MKFSHLTIFMIFSLCQMGFMKLKILTIKKVTKLTIFRRHENISQCILAGGKKLITSLHN